MHNAHHHRTHGVRALACGVFASLALPMAVRLPLAEVLTIQIGEELIALEDPAPAEPTPSDTVPPPASPSSLPEPTPAEPPTAPTPTIAVRAPTRSWGLDRIDQRSLPLDRGFSISGDGAGVRAYIVDTGINLESSDFTGRIDVGFSAIDSTTQDCHGHGTHVSGIVGGTDFGVAPAVTLVPVRVSACGGTATLANAIAGIDWAIADHVSGPAVMNISLGGSSSDLLDDAVARAVADGITVVVAAGNSNTDACTRSPARALEAITVAASTITDARYSASNTGTCVDLFAPGVTITSDWIGNPTATRVLSGTSMAAPHVAGAAAAYLSAHPDAAPAQVLAALLAGATTGVVIDAGPDSPNALMYVGPPTP
ncbi:MAG: S8 family peptidase [Acidimicrobiia bacterium]